VTFFPHAPAYETFQAMLAEARTGKGITQAALAARLGCPQSLISKVERGERRLDVPEFMTWALALGLDVHAFVDAYLAALRRPQMIGRALCIGRKRPMLPKKPR
jgi:transcriptional regulator with XRE-family HTH domain